MHSFNEATTMNFLSSNQQNIIIRLCDISGKILAQKDFRTLEGVNQYKITTQENGIYLINILTQANCYSVKGIVYGMGRNDIKYSGIAEMNTLDNSRKNILSDPYVLLFSFGDIIAYEFHSGESTTLIHEEAGASAILHPEFHNCVDYDGNSYSVVQIGSQWWMAENLQSTSYADGTEVMLMEDNDLWSLFIPSVEAYCYYNNDESLGYGGLYTYTAAVRGKPYTGIVESQGICPNGWHVPSDDDWMELKNYLIDNGFNWDGTTTENKIGKSLASSSGWVPNTIVEGSAGHDQESNNRTGFNAKPYGFRDDLKGLFIDEGYAGCWWSSSEKSDSYAYSWNIVNEMTGLNHWNITKTRGYSVRCIKNRSETSFANFSADKTEVSVGEEVRFTDLSSDEATKWFWDFGDLGQSTEQNPVHIYTSPGTYTVHAAFLIDFGTRYVTKTNYIRVSESTKRTVADPEGNTYKAVKIGNQLWMAENLKSTRYDSENEIPLITENSEWGSLAADNSTRAYCYYNNDINSGYGALYTYAAAVNGTPYDGTGHVQGS
jgi:uncharacterized protein (TIGR02145 family)